MANTATKVTATQNHLVYLLTGDGTVAGPTIASATLLADMVDGPLKTAWQDTYADQAAMRTALLGMGAGCRILVSLRTTPVDTTAQANQVVVDVDVDAVTATRAEINVSMSDTTGQVAYLHIEHLHSIVI